MSQHADDSSFMIRVDKQCMDELVRLLRAFREASCMGINWDESYA